jgi:uncharacterized protein YvpB
MFVLQLKDQGATVTLKAYYQSKTYSEHFKEMDGQEVQNMERILYNEIHAWIEISLASTKSNWQISHMSN